VIAALTAGIQLVYSSALYAGGVVMKQPDDQQPAPLTPAEKRSLPRVSRTNLPSVAMINKFPIDVRNTFYPEPNPVAKYVNTEAILPAGYYDAYLKRYSDGHFVNYPGRNQRAWMFDPNLNVGQFQAPLQRLPSVDITPQPCNPSSLEQIPACRASLDPLRHLHGFR